MMSTRFAVTPLATILLALGSFAAASAQGFKAVSTRDGIDVWAVGSSGAVYRSLDHGATWGTYPMGTADHRGVAARGARVWIVDADGTLWTSENTGFSFATSAPAGSVGLDAICFASDSVGWIAGAGGTVLQTVDAGQNWTAQSSGTGADLFAIRFHDALEGWACGAGGTVLHTTDGGTAWTAATPFAFTKDLHDIDFSGDTVYVAGTHAFCAKSENAGGSWTTVDLKITSMSDVNAVALRPGGTLWLGGGGGFLRRSTDGGRTWFFPQHTVVTGLADVYFHDNLNGWACAGRSKNVARTTDGGNTWSIPGGGNFTYTWVRKQSNFARPGLATIVRGNTLRIDPMNREKLWVVQGKFVMASWNLGENWSIVDSIPGVGNECNAFVVSATDTNTWLALFQFGDRIVRRTAPGVWTTVDSIPFTEYGLPLEQDVNNPDHVLFAPETTFAAGASQHLYESYDFGLTWSQIQSTPLFRSPDDIAVMPDTNGVILVADGVTGAGFGQIWKSSDGGLTWSMRAQGLGSEVPMLATTRLDRFLAYATFWTGGGVIRSQDMGTNWSLVSGAAAAWGADIAKDDPNVFMFATYSGGLAPLTLDRGATWRNGTLDGSNYGLLAYDRGTYFCHQSGGIWKSVFTQPDMPTDNAQSVTVIVPNGGEIWRYGDTDSIRWTSYNEATVKLEYQAKPLGPWLEIVPTTSATDGFFAWPIPGVGTPSARVRVSDAYTGSPADASDAPFTIVVPALTASPEALAFGQVDIGTTRTDTLFVTNVGSTTLVVSSVTVAGGGPFTPNRTSFSIPVDGSDTVLVLFEPTQVQTYDDTLRVASNAPDSPTLVGLSGAGHAVDAVGEALPLSFALRSNAPNPFGSSGTLISYALPRACDVKLEIFNVLGQRVATLVQGRQAAGPYALRFPGTGQVLSGGYAGALPSGVYFCRLKAGEFVATRRMVMIR